MKSHVCFLPAEGILSPLLWCLVLDKLLIIVERVGVYAEAQVEDLTILVRGKYGGVVLDVVQLALNTTEKSC